MKTNQTTADLDLDSFKLDIETVEENSNSDFRTISAKFSETRDRLRQEIDATRERLSSKDQGKAIPQLKTQEDVEVFKQEALARFSIASRAAQQLEDPACDKTIEETQKLLSDLVVAGDQFFIDMKIVLFHQSGFVVDACKTLEQEENAAKVPQHIAEIRRNIDSIAAMPDLDQLVELSSDVAKMASSYTQIAAFANSVNDNENGLVIRESSASRTLAANTSQAYRGIVQPFNDFVTRAKPSEKVSAQFDLKQSQAIERRVTFVNDVAENLENAFILSGAIQDGRVQRGESRVEYALSAMQGLVSIAAPAVIRQGMNGFLEAARFVVAAKKDVQNENVAEFATIAEGSEANQEERGLRRNIIHSVSSKIYQLYDHKDENGHSPLDSLTEQGRRKFASWITEDLVVAMGDFKFPDRSELPHFDRKQFATDAKYREEMGQKYAVEIDENKIGGARYLGEMISTIESKIYVDFVADSLVSKVVHGLEISDIVKKARNSVDRPRDFSNEDKIPERRNDKLNFWGMKEEAAVDLGDGKYLMPTSRLKDGEKPKYGFRLATAAEKKAMENNQEIAGYTVVERTQNRQKETTTTQSQEAATQATESQTQSQSAAEISHDPKRVIGDMQNLVLRQVEKHIAEFGEKQKKISGYVDKRHSELQTKLKEAQEDLAKKSEKKPRWKQALTLVTFRMYKGGLPNDVTQESKLVKDLETRIKQNRQDSVMLGRQTENIGKLREDIVTAFETKTEKKGVDLTNVTDSLRQIANLVETSREVVQAVQEHHTMNWDDARRKVGFNHTIAESFRQGFVIADALNQGKVQFSEDRVDKVLGAGQMVTGFIPPVAQQGMAIALQVGQVVNGIKKAHNAKTLANFGMEIGESGEEMRPLIVQAIGEKLHDTFSLRVAGKSILDNFTNPDRFADALSARVMDQMISYTMPKRSEAEKFDREKYDSDEKYREQITQKYGSVIDEKTVAKINDDNYADLVANQLIGAVLKTRKAGLSLDNFHFEDHELADHAKGKDLTIEGAMYRCAVEKDAQNPEERRRFIPKSRTKDLEKGDSKYGYRKELPGERIEQNSEYVEFDPAKQIYETAKEKVLQKLTAAHFKEGMVIDGDVAGALQKMVENYRQQKQENPNLRHGDFLKADQTLDDGESKRFFGVVVGKTAQRKEFNNELKKPLLALLDAADRLSLAELRGETEVVKPARSVVDGVKIGSATEVVDIFAAIKSAPKRDPKDLEELGKYGDAHEEIAHISAKVKAAKSTDAISAVADSIMSSATDIIETAAMVSEKVLGKKQTPVAVEVVAEKPDQKSLVDYVESRDSLLTMLNDTHLKENVATKNKDEIARGHTTKVLENCVTDFVQSYHAKVISGMTTENLEKFAAAQLPIKTENPIIASALVGLAVQYSEAMIEKAQTRRAEQPQVNASKVAEVPTVEVSGKDKLLADLHSMVGLGDDASAAAITATMKAMMLAMGGKVEGNKIKLPPVLSEAEGKKPMHFVIVVDPKTQQFTDVELHGGDVKGTKLFSSENKRQLFDKEGNIKASHVETVKDLMSKYQEKLGSKEEESVRGSESTSRESEVEKGRGSISESVAKAAKSAMKLNPMNMIRRAGRYAATEISAGGSDRDGGGRSQ